MISDAALYRYAGCAMRWWAEGRPCPRPGQAMLVADWLRALSDVEKDKEG